MKVKIQHSMTTANMVFHGKISPEMRAYIKYNKTTSVKELMKITGVSRRQMYRLKVEPLAPKLEEKCRKRHGGRPRKLMAHDVRRIVREVCRLRGTFPNWTAQQLMVETNITHVHVRTVRRVLNQCGYRYLQSLKKGLMSKKDRKDRIKFGKKMTKHYSPDVWTRDVAFFFDGVNFVHKTNPKGHALSPRGRVWRRKNEGLQPGCTSKGNKEGTGGSMLKMFVAISYDEGVICAQSYKKLNGENFADFVRENFNGIFAASKKQSRLWVQDGDPSQNSAKSKKAFQCVDAELLPIPPRSPDCNPIENVFKQVKDTLAVQAIRENIEKESFEQFEKRVTETLLKFPVDSINKVIESMGKRMDELICGKGIRLRY